MAKSRISLFHLLRGDDTLSDREKQMLRSIEGYGADVNARLHHIDRAPSDINHLGNDYAKTHSEKLNGTTNGIHIRQIDKDEYCQTLEVKYAPMGYAPSHTHPHYCVHEVLSGEVFDSVRGLRFDKGDWYITKPGEVHSAQSISGAAVRMFCATSQHIAEQIALIKRYDNNLYIQQTVEE